MQGLSLGDAFGQAVDALTTRDEFAGVEIVAHAVRRKGRALSLTLVIDRTQGVDIALCERITAHINAQLEKIEAPYTLEVESAGLERPLLRAGDYERFRGRNIKIVTTLLINGSKTHRGRLANVRGTNVVLETPSGELPLPLATIRSANLEYDIRNDLKREKQKRKSRIKSQHNGAPLA